MKTVGLTASDVRGAQPRYRRIVDALEAGIACGDLPSGARLPPERELAVRLRVSRTTVVSAYRELESRGLVRGFVGRGTFVCAIPDAGATPFAWRGKVAAAALRTSDSVLRDLVRDASDPSLISFAAGVPALDRFPAEEFQQAVRRVMNREGQLLWQHGTTEGQLRLRAAIGAQFGVRPQSVLVLAGAQQGLDLLARCLIDPGDAVVMDRPGYLGAVHTFRAAGARLIGWDIQRADTDELEDLVLRYRPKFLYTNPTFQNPTGITMPLRTRKDLLKLAVRYRLPIVEDDTYRGLHFSSVPPAPLYALDDQQIVIYLSSFSKVLAPGLRLGWLAAADSIVEQLTLIKQRVDPHTQHLAQLVVADLLESGVFAGHLEGLRDEHAHRCQAMLRSIARHLPAGALRFSRPDGGLYLWCRLGHGLKTAAVVRHARLNGVVFVPGEPFYLDQAGTQELRLCYSAVPADLAEKGIKSLAQSLESAAADGPLLETRVPIV